ncbi:Bacterial regulatory helix-turn-helix protein, AraC family [compost metagenome]
MAVESLDAALLDAMLRLVTLIDDPILMPRLAPLIRQEIIVRLLSGPHCLQLQHLAADGAPSQQIARSIAWLKQNFAEPLRVFDLAASAHMSPSTFRLHFRSVTGMGPLQYRSNYACSRRRDN